MDTKAAAEKWNCDRSNVAKWCKNGLVEGAHQEGFGRPWTIPDQAIRPIDRRLAKEIIWTLLELKTKRHPVFDLSIWGIKKEEIGLYLNELRSNLYIEFDSNDCDDYFITAKGFKLLGRHNCSEFESFDDIKVIADVAGVFIGSTIKAAFL